MRLQAVFKTEKRVEVESTIGKTGTKREFVKKIRISQVYLNQALKGKPISVKMAGRISGGLNSDIEHLFTLKEIN